MTNNIVVVIVPRVYD